MHLTRAFCTGLAAAPNAKIRKKGGGMMDTFYTQETCDRCGGSLAAGRTMSMYNRDCICMACKEAERQRADYAAAVEADQAAIRQGNYNFPGIGLQE